MGYVNIIRGFIFFSGVCILLACERFEGEQTVPAYLHVDTVFLQNNPLLEEGYLTHNFTDVWVYVDDQIIGAFELPATIPILASGKHKVALNAGVIYNGISGTRGAYLLTRPRVYQELDLVIGSVLERNPAVSYYDNTLFLWMEDFEGSALMVVTSSSDTSIQKYNRDQADEFLGLSSGMGNLDNAHTVWEVTSFDPEKPGYPFPAGGQPVFLEMEYNTNNLISVGIFVTETGVEITRHPVVIFQPTGGVWKKAYVNLSPAISAFNTNDYFNIYLRADKEQSVEQPLILIDNLKLINRVAY